MYLPVYTYTYLISTCDAMSLHLQNASTAPADLSLRRRSMYIDKSSLPSKETTKRQEKMCPSSTSFDARNQWHAYRKINLSLPLYFSGCVIPKALNSRWLCRCCSSTPALILGWLLHPGPAAYEHSASDRASFQSLHGSPPFAGCPIRLSHRNTQKHRCILRPLDLSSFPVPLAGHNGSSVPSKSRHFSSRETRRTPLTLLWTPANAECRAMCHPCHNFSRVLLQFARECVGMSCPAKMDKAQTCIKCQVLKLFHLQHRRAGSFFGATIDTPETWLSLSCSRKSLALTTSIFHVPTHKAHQSSKEKSWTSVNLYQFSSQNSRAPTCLRRLYACPRFNEFEKCCAINIPLLSKWISSKILTRV